MGAQRQDQLGRDGPQSALLDRARARGPAREDRLLGSSTAPRWRPRACRRVGASAIISTPTTLTYNTKAWGGPRAQPSWADLWNVKEFPGKRAFRAPCRFDAILEAAADGRRRAARPAPTRSTSSGRSSRSSASRSMRSSSTTLAQSQQVFRDREAVAGPSCSTRRATPLIARHQRRMPVHLEAGHRAGWHLAGAQGARRPAARPGSSSPRPQDPAGQVELFKRLGNGPIKPGRGRR